MAVRNGRNPKWVVIQSSPVLKRRRASCVARNVTDEVQYAVHKSLIKNVSFYNEAVDADYKERLKAWKEAGADKKTKPANPFEEAAEQFIETNKSDDPLEQFSDIGHTDKGIHYVTTPNVVSRTIIKAIDDTVKYHNLKVPLGIAWITGLNWKMCH